MSFSLQDENLGELTETTLDEPVTDTILRDLKQVGIKLFHVILPHGKGAAALRDWDLWGPLLWCFGIALTLSQIAPHDQRALVFSAVFVVIWFGSVFITLNASLLGGNVSFFQSVCLLGYCVFPLFVASIISLVFSSLLVRLVAVGAGFAWSTFASYGFMAQMVPASRKALAVYPVFLFYLVLSWMILIRGSDHHEAGTEDVS